MKRNIRNGILVICGVFFFLLTAWGASAFSWFGLFPEKIVTPDVQYKTEPLTTLDRLNNFFLQHQEFRNLPGGTSIGLAVQGSEPSTNNYFLVTEKGISQTQYQDVAGDANVWVSQSFLERLLSTSDLCGFLSGLKSSPEDGTSYGLIQSRHWFSLRWKFGGGNNYCPGGNLWL